MNLYRVRLRFQCDRYSLTWQSTMQADHGVKAIQSWIRRAETIKELDGAQLAFSSALYMGQCEQGE